MTHGTLVDGNVLLDIMTEDPGLARTVDHRAGRGR